MVLEKALYKVLENKTFQTNLFQVKNAQEAACSLTACVEKDSK